MEFTINKNHELIGKYTSIARSNENLVEIINITIEDDSLLLWDPYIEFQNNDCEKISTPKLEYIDNKISYALPLEVLKEGILKIQVVFRNQETKQIWKTNIKQYFVNPSINASEFIETNNPDFITNAQKILTDCEAAADKIINDVFTKDEIYNLLNTKVSKIEGKDLSSNDFTDEYKKALDDLIIKNIIDIQLTELSPTLDFEKYNYRIPYSPSKVGRYNEDYIFLLEDIGQTSHNYNLIVTGFNNSEGLFTAYGEKIKGDTYFSNNDLSKWEIKFKLNSGNIEIIYLKDEFNNESNFDFKNVLFERYSASLNMTRKAYYGNSDNSLSELSMGSFSLLVSKYFYDEELSGGKTYSFNRENILSVTINSSSESLNYYYMFGPYPMSDSSISGYGYYKNNSINVEENYIKNLVFKSDVINNTIKTDATITICGPCENNNLDLTKCNDYTFICNGIYNTNISDSDIKNTVLLYLQNCNFNHSEIEYSIFYYIYDSKFDLNIADYVVMYNIHDSTMNIYNINGVSFEYINNTNIFKDDGYFEGNYWTNVYNSYIRTREDIYDVYIYDINYCNFTQTENMQNVTLYGIKNSDFENLHRISSDEKTSLYQLDNCKLINCYGNNRDNYIYLSNIIFINCEIKDGFTYNSNSIYYNNYELASKNDIKSNDSIIEVNELPTTNINTNSLYKINKYNYNAKMYYSGTYVDNFICVRSLPDSPIEGNIYVLIGSNDTITLYRVSGTSYTDITNQAVISIVSELPTSPLSGTVYIVKTANNNYGLYYHDDEFKKLATTDDISTTLNQIESLLSEV